VLAEVPPEESLLIRGTYFQLETDHDWLALHPGAASAAGLVALSDDPLAWTLDGDLAIRSLWWRSGFTGWSPYHDEDEVSEGWLVLASPSAVERLRETFPSARLLWEIVRSWRPREQETEERACSGERAF
jgi:hypothetical protein